MVRPEEEQAMARLVPKMSLMSLETIAHSGGVGAQLLVGHDPEREV